METIAIDPPGVGRSTMTFRPLSIVELVQVYTRLIRQLGLESAHDIGCSFGGAVAQQLTLSHPARVRSAVLAGTGPRSGECQEIRWRSRS